MRIGFFLATEEFTPDELLAQARAAEESGFHGLWISDHYHPWNREQGQSPFVWTVLGALSQVTSRGPVTTAVTCPTLRIHPAVMAQAAATTALMLGDRFRFGVGSGEALNEHILGAAWPSAAVRLEMLEEAVGLIRELWRGGVVHHRGDHYRVEHARVYTRPGSAPPIPISGFGPKAVDLAARIGDGYVITMPDADLIGRFRSNGGGDKPVQAGMKVCWAADEAEARRTARRLWPNEALPGELAQVLPTPGALRAGDRARDRGHGGRGCAVRARRRPPCRGNPGVRRRRGRRALHPPDRRSRRRLLRHVREGDPETLFRLEPAVVGIGLP